MASLNQATEEYDDHQNMNSEETPFIAEPPMLAAVDGEDPREKYRWRVLALIFVVTSLIEVAIVIAMPAWSALLEKGLCSEIHPDIANTFIAGDENPTCKDPVVQGKLAMYRGWGYALDAIPTILLSIPLGSLSDRLGRKFIGGIAVMGVFVVMLAYQVVFYFPLPMWTYLLCFVFYTIGGGAPVAISMMYTMLADVVHVGQMATVLFRFNSLFLLAELVSTPLGGFLLGQGPWVALMTSNLIMIIAMGLIYCIPETLSVRHWHDARNGKLAKPPSANRYVQGLPERSKLQAGLDAAREQILQVWDFVISNNRAAILIMPFVFISLGKYIQELLLQYATKRYGWTWSKATYFLTLKSASFVVMLTLILPALSTLCLKKLRMSPLSKDLWLSRWSAVLLILADVVITFSATPFLYAGGLVLLAGGCGLSPLLRSLLNSLVEPHHVGILNTLVGFLETLGIMIAAPIFSKALQAGIELGGGWIGLPFAVGTLVTCAATTIVWLYRIPAQLERDIVAENHEA